MLTPDGPPLQLMIDASKGKGKIEMEEQWLELSNKRGIGSGLQQNLLGSNGTKKLEFSGEEVKKPWADLFATNRLATRGMNLNYIPPVIVDGEKVVEILPEDVAQDDEK
ncbi:hypothetical protein H5410_031284 [Solanum commersonii]|uniref:Uncharacterized protein n=1 Tax=Solanum commersonii TaxID=4109 RepID=A0A9J5YHX8_SOLCO|nr:hypothetical protein H5410_031284 [Solanum commersonii]